MKEFTKNDIFRAYGVIKTNGLGTRGIQALSMFPYASIFSHSCDRNILPVVGPGEVVVFKSTRKISKGEELTIRLVSLFYGQYLNALIEPF